MHIFCSIPILTFYRKNIPAAFLMNNLELSRARAPTSTAIIYCALFIGSISSVNVHCVLFIWAYFISQARNAVARLWCGCVRSCGPLGVALHTDAGCWSVENCTSPWHTNTVYSHSTQTLGVGVLKTAPVPGTPTLCNLTPPKRRVLECWELHQSLALQHCVLSRHTEAGCWSVENCTSPWHYKTVDSHSTQTLGVGVLRTAPVLGTPTLCTLTSEAGCGNFIINLYISQFGCLHILVYDILSLSMPGIGAFCLGQDFNML